MLVSVLLQALQLPTATSHEPKKKAKEYTSICVLKFYHKGPGSVVGIATGYGLDGPASGIRMFHLDPASKQSAKPI